MGVRNMAEEKPEARRLGSILILALVVVCALLVIAEISSNVVSEIDSYENQAISSATPIPLSSQAPGEPTATLFEMHPLE